MRKASTGPCGGGAISEAVAQGVPADELVDLGHTGGMAGAVELMRGERIDPVRTGKEPALRLAAVTRCAEVQGAEERWPSAAGTWIACGLPVS